MSKLRDTNWFITKAKSIHGNSYVYDNSVYINAKEKIEIKCLLHKKTFFQTSNNHFNSKYPCEDCKTDYKRTLFSDGINGFTNKMESKFGNVFDYTNTIYKNQSTKVKIRCKNCKSDIFSTPQSLLNSKGCSYCFQKQTKGEFKTNKLKEINDYVMKIGGKCLSIDYLNNLDNLKFQCKKGHIFYESWADVKYSMRWCKECAPNRLIGETLTRMILEHLLTTKMPSTYLRTMGRLQLDGYCNKLKVAFEYQGYQHYTKGSYFHNDADEYKKQQARDSQKNFYARIME